MNYLLACISVSDTSEVFIILPASTCSFCCCWVSLLTNGRTGSLLLEWPGRFQRQVEELDCGWLPRPSLFLREMEERASSSSLRDNLNSFGLRSGLCETRKVRGRRFFKGIKGVGIFWSFLLVSFSFPFLPSLLLCVSLVALCFGWGCTHSVSQQQTTWDGRESIFQQEQKRGDIHHLL